MNGDDEYRRQAADAEKQARSAKNELDRASWLRIAQGWLGLLHKRPQSDEEAFDTQSKAKAQARRIPNPRIKTRLSWRNIFSDAYCLSQHFAERP